MLEASPPNSPQPSNRGTPRSSVLRRSSMVTPFRGGSIFQYMSGAMDEEEDPSSLDAGKKPQVDIAEILNVASSDVVITEALKKAVLDVSDQFGINVVDANMKTGDELRSRRLRDHVGRNQDRLVRGKVQMARPPEIPKVDIARKRLGAKEREHTRSANRKLAISLLFQFEQMRIVKENSHRQTTMLLANNKKQQTKQLVIMTFVKGQIETAVRSIRNRIVAEQKKRKKERERQTRAVRKIFRVWRTYRVINFRTAMLSFVRFRKFYERTMAARDEEAFKNRIQKRDEREKLVFNSYQQRRGKPLVIPGTALAMATADFEYPRRRAVDAQLDTDEDLVSLWMLDRISPAKRLAAPPSPGPGDRSVYKLSDHNTNFRGPEKVKNYYYMKS